MEYYVESKWCGWFGGYGSEGDITAVLNRASAEGWRLTSIKVERHAWNWIFFRPKLLMFFERQLVR